MATAIVGAIEISKFADPAAARAQTPSERKATRADFDRYMKELSNWGRWGKDDRMGAVNLITPAKRKQALAAVKEGVSIFHGAHGGSGAGG